MKVTCFCLWTLPALDHIRQYVPAAVCSLSVFLWERGKLSVASFPWYKPHRTINELVSAVNFQLLVLIRHYFHTLLTCMTQLVVSCIKTVVLLLSRCRSSHLDGSAAQSNWKSYILAKNLARVLEKFLQDFCKIIPSIMQKICKLFPTFLLGSKELGKKVCKKVEIN